MNQSTKGPFAEVTVSALRAVAGFLFMSHGVQKLFGAFGGTTVDSITSMMGLAGGLEFVGGLFMMIGLGTRPVAFILSGMMATAYFTAHLPRGVVPIMNGGELAALYSWIWLFFCANGGGKYSLDAVLEKRKLNAPI